MKKRLLIGIVLVLLFPLALALPIRPAVAADYEVSMAWTLDTTNHKEAYIVLTTTEGKFSAFFEVSVVHHSPTIYNITVDLSSIGLGKHYVGYLNLSETLPDAPGIGTATAFHVYFSPGFLSALRMGVALTTVGAAILLTLYFVFKTIKDFYAGDLIGFIDTFFGWLKGLALLTIGYVIWQVLGDSNTDGSTDLYFPWAPRNYFLTLLGNNHYYVATKFNWWNILLKSNTVWIWYPFWGYTITWFETSVWSSRKTPQTPPPITAVAAFDWSPEKPYAGENVTFMSRSYALNGTINETHWWLGDGREKTSSNFTCSYQTAGIYNVTLQVTATNGHADDIKNITQAIEVRSAAAALRVNADHLEIEVQKGQNTSAVFQVGETLNLTDLQGVIFQSSDWSAMFGTQTISSGNVTFNRNGIEVAKGSFTSITATFHAPLNSPAGWFSGNITIASENGGNATIITNIFVYGPPNADFAWSPITPKVGEMVTFNASSSVSGGNPIIEYEWSLGDGNTMTNPSPILGHAYTSAGTYNVTLTVRDSTGLTNSTWELISVGSHDVAVITVAPYRTWVYSGRSTSVNVTVTNEGDFTESFDVTVFYNITTGQILDLPKTVTGLPPGENTTLTFSWNTTGVQPCHNYTITAVASQVPHETHLADNTMSSIVSIKVRFLGDLNGDGTVDIRDLSEAAKAFGSYKHPMISQRWNSDVDINEDGVVDIRDLALIAKNFGKSCP